MLIQGAEVWCHGIADVRISGGRVEAIGRLLPFPGETVIEGCGHALLPGLHDHHIHLAGLAARRASVLCGPPEVNDGDALAARLRQPGTGWLRGIGYHESVMGLPDARALDRLVPDRPLRMQHRGGRMWLLNSRALDILLASGAPPAGLEREGGRFTGRLFNDDAWLRTALGSVQPDFGRISRELSAFGITGITDMTPQNDGDAAQHFTQQRSSGALLQQVTLAGTISLAEAAPEGWTPGPAKLHLHEAAMPDFDTALDFIHAAHETDRGVAIHCTTEVEVVFALALIEEAGPHSADRIEHASIADPGHVERIAALGLSVCVQPHFIAERGDAYLANVEPHHHPNLYRLASLAAAGIPLAGGSDAPFGVADPWAAMQAAMCRQAPSGAVIGANEALSPEAALDLWLADPADLRRVRRIAPGEPADLVLLNHPWREARRYLSSNLVSKVWTGGNLVHEAPFERPAS